MNTTYSAPTTHIADIPNKTYEAALKRNAQVEEQLAKDPSVFRMLTGDRPTGALHIGHYFGTLKNRVRLQQQGVETWILVADYQVITDRDVAGDIKGSVRELLTDYLAAGIDPERATIFAHSGVPELNQLMLPFLSLVTQPELERNPTAVSYTHLTLPTTARRCRSRWSPYH